VLTGESARASVEATGLVSLNLMLSIDQVDRSADSKISLSRFGRQETINSISRKRKSNIQHFLFVEKW
jgi:hypothetical protein